MRNRFNLNESDKSHIRVLHGINEQSNNIVPSVFNRESIIKRNIKGK